MKKLLLIIIVFVFASCTEKQNKIEPDFEKVYTAAEDVTEFQGPINSNLDLNLDEVIDLAFRTIKGNKKYFTSTHRIFINENGDVDRIKILSDEVTKLNQLIAKAQLKMKFKPALMNGIPVKSKYDWLVIVPLNKEEKANIEVTLNYTPPEIYKAEAEKSPEPIGGIKGIAENVIYPEEAKKNNIQGRVFIKAFINEEGLVEKAEVIKGIGSGCDEAALNAVKNTKFIPGMNDGKPIKAQIAIPIMFKLQ